MGRASGSLPQEVSVLLDKRAHAAVPLGRDGSVEEEDVQVVRLRLEPRVDEVLERLLFFIVSEDKTPPITPKYMYIYVKVNLFSRSH